jgi:hypothetical protein
MTALNYVTLTGQWTSVNDAGVVNYGSGNVEITASGTLVTSGDDVLTIPAVLVQLDDLGALSLPGTAANSGIPVLASDNYGAGVLTYDFKLLVQEEVSIDVSDVAINYGSGASQVLLAALEAAGWTPVSD